MDESGARYIVDVLQAREHEGVTRRWLWSAKKKAALYFVRALEQQVSPRRARFGRIRERLSSWLGLSSRSPGPAEIARDSPPLTDEEKDFIFRTHPLLQNAGAVSPRACLQSHRQWHIDIRNRVSEFLGSRPPK
jgi:hypothetical protein